MIKTKMTNISEKWHNQFCSTPLVGSDGISTFVPLQGKW